MSLILVQRLTLFAMLLVIFVISSIMPTSLAILSIWISAALLSMLSIRETFDWKAPLAVIPILFSLYYTVFPIYFLLGGERLTGVGPVAVNDAVDLSRLFILGLGFGALFSGNIGQKKGRTERQTFKIYGFSNIVTYAVLIAFIGLYSISFYQLAGVAGASKADRMSSGTVSAQVFFGGIYLPYLLIQCKSLLLTGKLNRPLMIAVFTLGGIGFTFFGERDQIIYPIILTVMLYGYFNKIPLLRVVILSVVLLVSLFVLGLIREFGENGQIRFLTNLALILQENEFISAGRNLAVVLQSDVEYLWGATFIGDVLNAIFVRGVPTGLQWFSESFYSNKGFSIVAEAYVNFGQIGVFFFASFFAITMNYFYKKSFQTNLHLTLYVLMLVGAIYCLRSDMSAVVSAPAKKWALPIIVLCIASMFVGPRAIPIFTISKSIRNV